MKENELLKASRIPRKLRSIFYRFYYPIILKLSGVQCGVNLKIYNRTSLQLHVGSHVSIGNNFLFISGESYNPLCRNIKGCICVEEGGSLNIGNNVGISSACIWVHESITIGNDVKIGGDCILVDSDCHSLDFMERRDNEADMAHKKNRPIIIEDDVLIGTRCIILKGVTIGARSVIGAGSVVTQDIPSDSIAAGNPCRVIKRRQV